MKNNFIVKDIRGNKLNTPGHDIVFPNHERLSAFFFDIDPGSLTPSHYTRQINVPSVENHICVWSFVNISPDALFSTIIQSITVDKKRDVCSAVSLADNILQSCEINNWDEELASENLRAICRRMK